MSLQELRKQIYNLSVMERLALMEAIAQSLQQELRPRPDRAARMEALTRLRGIAKTDEASPTDAEATEAYVDYLMEKYK
ncbi:hypothetical protein [Microcoleus sp. FACHB-672]|uniref:hypothetical protein n=1 Tax=Microcoleus sp. FACHB-672 TaxID=2692825 RepID=UPI0016888C07|nr:hypothetical protein [Microcoleus sp. FACHB-672]MBD2040204.1 hypothetical protein [Microcoleus sp. FACHB-672]